MCPMWAMLVPRTLVYTHQTVCQTACLPHICGVAHIVWALETSWDVFQFWKDPPLWCVFFQSHCKLNFFASSAKLLLLPKHLCCWQTTRANKGTRCSVFAAIVIWLLGKPTRHPFINLLPMPVHPPAPRGWDYKVILLWSEDALSL